MKSPAARLLAIGNQLRRFTIDCGPMGDSTPLRHEGETLIQLAESMAAPSVPLSKVARIVRETVPAAGVANGPDPRDEAWRNGCEASRERIANQIADLSDLRPSERAEFCRAAGVSDLKG